MDALLEMKRNVLRWKDQIAAIKADLVFRRLIDATIKAGFKEEQDRDELGRWTSEGSIDVTTSSGFWTGIPTIDDTSLALSDTLVSVMEKMEYLPGMNPATYGTAVHAAFGVAVSTQGLQGVGDIERSFSIDTLDPAYGLAGSIRTDVTLRDVQGDIVAIYDVKTGNARISQARADELRTKTGSAPNTPVFELNIVRGISRKNINRFQYSLFLTINRSPEKSGRN